MKIELLSEHPRLIPEIVDLKFQEFSYLVPQKTKADFLKGVQAHLSAPNLPIAYVIVTEEKEFVGTFSLRQCDMESHSHFTPWVGSILVHPSKRNQGIGSILVKNAELTALEMGFAQLYLFTPNKAAWYAKLGWETVEKTLFNEIPVTVMTKNLRSVNGRDAFPSSSAV